MNDPMTSVEIEDVLSSIRRLVSEDLRPVGPRDAGALAVAAAPAAPSRQNTASVAEASKLLLTPALRVVPPVAAPELEPELDPAPVDPVAEAPFIAIGEEGARADAAPEAPDAMGAVVARIGAQVTDDWDAELEPEAETWAAPVWEPELVEVDLETVEEAEVLHVTTVEDARLEDAWRDGAWADAAPQADPEDWDQDEGATVHQITVDADLPAETVHQITAQAPLSPELADLAEAAVLAEIDAAEAAAAAAIAATPGIFAPDDGDDFDEEALREVVRDIIREELQGALGERITRNVRKLVRAEINRAFASRELS